MKSKIKRKINKFEIKNWRIARQIAFDNNIGMNSAYEELKRAFYSYCEPKEYYQKEIYKQDLKTKEETLDKYLKDYVVSKICLETGVSKEDALAQIEACYTTYFIRPREYCQGELYKKSKEEILESLHERKLKRAEKAATEMECSVEEILERMEKVCSEFRISFVKYFTKKYYKYHEMDILTKLKRSGRYQYGLVNIVAEEKGISYDEAKRELEYYRSRYSIPYTIYIVRMYYMLSEKEIVEDISDYVQIVADDAGWSYNEALQEMTRMRKIHHISFARYCYCRYFSVTEEEAVAAENEYKTNRFNEIVYYAAKSGKSIPEFYETMRLDCLKYGDPEDYYYAIEFFNMDDEKKKNYLHGRDGDHILPRKYNTDEGYQLLYDKYEFNKEFTDELNRKWWINLDDVSYESFCKFCEGLNELFIKPIKSSRGRGCKKVVLTEENKAEVYNDLMEYDETVLAEQCIKSHPDIAGLGGGSVSSIRVLTVYHNDKANIISAYLRVGTNEITDNISIDGVAIEIDKDTGITISDGINKMGERFTHEKCSGIEIKGIQIPFWDEVLELVDRTMEKLKGRVGYAGLDVAITQSGPVLIEANSHAHLHRIEFFKNEGNGNRSVIEEYL